MYAIRSYYGLLSRITWLPNTQLPAMPCIREVRKLKFWPTTKTNCIFWQNGGNSSTAKVKAKMV